MPPKTKKTTTPTKATKATSKTTKSDKPAKPKTTKTDKPAKPKAEKADKPAKPKAEKAEKTTTKSTKAAKAPFQPKVPKTIIRPSDESVVRMLFTKDKKLILPPHAVFVTGTKKVIRIQAADLRKHIKSTEFGRVFYDLYSTDESCDILVPNIEPDPFIYLLIYVYDCRIFKRHCEISSVCQLARQYSIPDLADKLIRSCNENITAFNCALLYDQYLKLGTSVSQYLDRVLEVVYLHADVAFRSRLFKYVGKETLLKLLASDHLFIAEKDLYYACLRWINSQLVADQKTVNAKNQLPLFNELKHLIRFPVMSKEQFYLGPARSQLLSQSELDEFQLYFETEDEKVFTTNYNTNERNGLQIHKLRFDTKKRTIVQVDRHAGFDSGELVIDQECPVIDLDERDKAMAKQFGKNYSNDGKKRKKATDSAAPAGKKKIKTENQPVEVIHIFKFQLLFDDQSQIEELWNDELAPEIHVEGVRLPNLQFSRYSASGRFYIALNRPVPVSSGKEFRICFRTRSNQCLHNTFTIANVITVDDDEARVEVKLRIQDKTTLRMADKAEIYFLYREDYVDPGSLNESNSSVTSIESACKVESGDSTLESVSDASKENMDCN